MHGGGDTITQIISDFSTSNLYTRSGNPSNTGGSGGWTGWVKVAVQSDIDKLTEFVKNGTEITDVTQITKGGMYYSNSNVSNAPKTDGSFCGYYASANGWIVTIFGIVPWGSVYYSTNDTSDGSTWRNSGWTEIANKADLSNKISNQMTGLASGTDINTIIKVGFYTGSNLTNAPSTDWITLIHMIINNDTNYNVQIAKVMNDATLYVREQRGGTWDGWTSLATYDALVNSLSNKANISDLYGETCFYSYTGYWSNLDSSYSNVNNIKRSGIGNTINTYTNLPGDTDGWGTLVCFGKNTNREIQIFYAWNYNRYYIRSCEGGTWQSWVKMISTADFTVSGNDLILEWL